MSEPFIAEIRIFAGNFAPRGWAFCDGTLLSVAQNTALFSLVGTTYGGNGRTNFGIPDMQGRAPLHLGIGPGLSSRNLGQTGGAETVPVTAAQMPAHNHSMQGTLTVGQDNDPAPDALMAGSVGGAMYADPTGSTVPLAPEAVTTVGSSEPHNNMQPTIVLNFIIALLGVYPSRS